MPNIENQIVNRFIQEAVRPVAESIRDLDADMTDMDSTYSSIIVPILSNALDRDLIIDNRVSEGVQPLTVGDVRKFVILVKDFDTILARLGQRDVVRKPIVRILRR